MPVKRSKNQVRVLTAENDEFSIIDGGRFVMMTMRWRPLADRSRFQLQLQRSQNYVRPKANI